MKKNQYVVKNNNGWAVRGEGNTKLTRIVHTQKEAMGIARTIAKNQKSEMIVQDKNGRFRICNSYGNDPCPPPRQKQIGMEPVFLQSMQTAGRQQLRKVLF